MHTRTGFSCFFLFFAAIACAERNPDARVTVFELTGHPLAKVRISGGGRCNVTTAFTEPQELVPYRGHHGFGTLE